jgi:hypothetical protein
MSNPSAFPDVFVSIFLALELDSGCLDTCRKVSRAWNDFIRGYLWQSAKVAVSGVFKEDNYFCQIFNAMIIFLQKLEQKAILFAKCFGKNIFKIITSVPAAAQ